MENIWGRSKDPDPPGLWGLMQFGIVKLYRMWSALMNDLLHSNGNDYADPGSPAVRN